MLPAIGSSLANLPLAQCIGLNVQANMANQGEPPMRLQGVVSDFDAGCQGAGLAGAGAGRGWQRRRWGDASCCTRACCAALWA